MFNSESHIFEGGTLEGEPEVTQEVAQKRLERASSINSVTPTSVSLWDLSKPSEGEKQKIMRVKVNKSLARLSKEETIDGKLRAKTLAHAVNIDVCPCFSLFCTYFCSS